MPLFSLGLLAFLLGGCAALAMVSATASVTTTAVKTTAKGVAGTRAAGRAIAGTKDADMDEPADTASADDGEPLVPDSRAQKPL